MDIYGVIGYPIKHSLSPAIHNAAFEKLGIDAVYKKFEIKPEELEDFLVKDIIVKDTEGNATRSKDILGFNITIPHKVRAKEILEDKFSSGTYEKLLQYVKLSGAVNTVQRVDKNLVYYNTDVEGFSRSLKEEGFMVRDKKVLLIGCGGAGRAVVTALIWRWENPYVNNIYIYEKNEDVCKAAESHFLQFSGLKGRLEFISYNDIPKIIHKCSLLVNATPMGMKDGDDDVIVIDKTWLQFSKNLCIYDLVYNRETRLIKDARLLDIKAVGGRGMLLHQGVTSLELWRGIKKLPQNIVAVMREALNNALDKQ